MAPRQILYVLTSHSKLGTSGRATGWYLPEFAHPYYVLKDAGYESVIASPRGGEAPLDQNSVQMFKDDAESQKFFKEESSLWENTVELEKYLGHAAEFEALVIPGGHGPMFDLATDTKSQQLIREFYEAGKVVSAVCHGPAALVNVKLSDGSLLIKDQPLTAFSNAEEDSVDLSKYMPFMLETGLTENGAKYEKAAEPWGVKVVTAGKGGRLITGQNPASAGPMAKAVLEVIGKA